MYRKNVEIQTNVQNKVVNFEAGGKVFILHAIITHRTDSSSTGKADWAAWTLCCWVVVVGAAVGPLAAVVAAPAGGLPPLAGDGADLDHIAADSRCCT